jgi:hypothetical protein
MERASERPLSELKPEELEALWVDAKRKLRNSAEIVEGAGK